VKVAVVYNEPKKGAIDSEDVLDQVGLVSSSLDRLGWEYTTHSLGEAGSPPHGRTRQAQAGRCIQPCGGIPGRN